jgi:hypothetical protein
MKLFHLAALFCLLSSVVCPLAAQMPGAGGTRLPPQVGGTAATTGAELVWATPGGAAIPVNCNQAGDTPFTVVVPAPAYRINNIVTVAESGSFTTAKMGLYTAPNGGGNQLVGQTALSTLTTTSPNQLAGSFNIAGAVNAVMTQKTLYLNTGTAQGGLCQINVYVAVIPLANG